jgi:HK97 gp10 family phage protein
VSDFSVQVSGLKELATAARRSRSKVIPAAMRAANKAIAKEVADRARALAPHRSGKLADSVRAGGSATSAYVAVGGPRVPYAQAIHWGWGKRHIAANPFLTTAAKRVEVDVDAWYGKVAEAIAEDWAHD